MAIAKRTFDAVIVWWGGVSRKQGPRAAGMRPTANRRRPPTSTHILNEERT
jgi:hypothetical protein